MAVAQMGCGAAEVFLRSASKQYDHGIGKSLNIIGWKDIVEVVRVEDRTGIYLWEKQQ
jgi:hypothetical protein